VKEALTPVAPTDPGGRDSRDQATGGYDLLSLERLIRDTHEQPGDWRHRTDLCHAYYDGKQLTQQQQLNCIAEGLEPRSTNLIQRVVNSVLGYEAKTRADVRIEADDDEVADIVDVYNDSMKEAQREAMVDMAVSQAYAGQVKGGVDWVEVSRDQDPLNYPYLVREVHRSEIYWDWRAKDFMLRDARWMVRMQWHDLDELEAAMPKHRQILRLMSNSWEGWAANMLIDEHMQYTDMQRAFDNFRRFTITSNEWLDSRRKQVKMYEVWYKVPAYAIVLRMGPTRTVLYDEKDPVHVQAVARGLVKVEKVLTRQVRRALFAGPYRLADDATTRRNFPYIPFFAFRDDETRAPYGLIDGMISPQDEYNERRLRIQWLLKARQVTVDNDALDQEKNNFVDLENNVQRPDMLLILNAARKNANGVVISSNLSLQREQLEAMQDAKQLIQEQPGVYGSQLGQAQGGVTANSAMQTLVEQGVTSMGELNDNFRMGRRMVYEAILELINQDHATRDLKVSTGIGAARRVVVLNTVDKQTGAPINQTKDVPIRVGMSDAPTTQSARAAQATQVSEIIKALAFNPQAAAVMVTPYLEAANLDSETKRQTIEDFRKAVGMPPVSSRAARAAADQAAAAEASKQGAMKEALAAATVDKAHAEVAETISKTELNDAAAKEKLAKAAVATTPLQDHLQQLIAEAFAEADGQTPGQNPSMMPAPETVQ